MPEIRVKQRPGMTSDVSTITFCVESMMTKGGRKAYKADADGYYRDVPMLAIGTTTRANSFYTPESVEEQIKSPNSQFNICLTEGYLFGEWGHPDLDLLTDQKQQMARIVRVDERLQSHHFRKVYTGPALESAGKLILGDIKPKGPYAQYVKETAEDPNVNTAFSLRSLTRNTQQGNVSKRHILKLITIDCVGAPGFMQASKAFAPISTESIATEHGRDLFTYSLPEDGEGNLLIDQLSTESFSNSELNEIMGAHKVLVQRRQTHAVQFGDPSRVNTAARQQGYFSDFVRQVKQQAG